ncbi:MAG: Gx transporter family protein [Lachnospiraceae bacterium]|nr:Gx transporter family protein [Lachnospiraceae bacterium]
MKDKRFRTIAYSGILVAVAFLLSYIEMLIPLPIGIPGVKLGLANLVVFAAIYMIEDKKTVYMIAIVRIILTAITFGNAYSFLFSFAGGMLSLSLMYACQKRCIFGRIGISILGGVGHNVAQIAVAALVLETPELVWYLPTLLIAGTIAGAVIGLVGALVLERVLGQYKGVDKSED